MKKGEVQQIQKKNVVNTLLIIVPNESNLYQVRLIVAQNIRSIKDSSKKVSVLSNKI